LLKFINIHKSFGSLKIFSDFNYCIEDGHFVCICGASGIGKTTFLQMVAGISKPDKGTVDLNGCSRIGYVFQEPRLLPWCTVRENIELVLYAYHKNNNQRINTIAEDLIHKLKLTGFADYYPSQISGGMKQRVSLARAFAVEPDVLLLDEPFSALDDKLKNTLRELLLDLLDWKPCTTILVTHDLREALLLGKEIVIFDQRPVKIAKKIGLSLPYNERTAEYCEEMLAKVL